MRLKRNVFAAFLSICACIGLFSITASAEDDTVTETTISISSDDTFSYVDSNDDGIVNTGDILYVGTEGLYVWNTPSNIDSTTDEIRTVTVKKVNTNTYLQDDSAGQIYVSGGDPGWTVVNTHKDNYVTKLNQTYNCNFSGVTFSNNGWMNHVKNTEWAYEFNWWSTHHHNTGNWNSSSMINTNKTYTEWASGWAYCRPGVAVKVSYIKAARDAMYDVKIKCTNGSVEVAAVANNVTINPVPNQGYILDSILVTDENGNIITVTDNKFTMPANNITIEAIFRKYNVSFESNGGSVVEIQKVEVDGKATNPQDPTKTGYVFVGWYSDEDLTVEYDFDTLITSDIELYAKWKVCSHENDSAKAGCDTTAICSLCGGEIKALGHNYAVVKYNETEHWYECTVCSEQKPDSREVHDFKWVTDVAPTENSNGSKFEICSCGKKRNENTVIPAINNSTEDTSEDTSEIVTDASPSTGDSMYFPLMVMFFAGIILCSMICMAVAKQNCEDK